MNERILVLLTIALLADMVLSFVKAPFEIIDVVSIGALAGGLWIAVKSNGK